MTTEQRKKEHIEICLENDVEANDNSFSEVILIHQSLPEIDLEEIDTTTEFLGKKFNIPLIISDLD